MSYKILENCTGCTICAKSCPVFAIEGELKEQHSINQDRCIDCGVCGRVCPVEAVIDNNGRAVKKVPRSKWTKPNIDKELCSACQICIEVCPFNVIEIIIPNNDVLKAYADVTNEKKCVSCSLCESDCPLDAIVMEVPHV